jgi:hypothetical protein
MPLSIAQKREVERCRAGLKSARAPISDDGIRVVFAGAPQNGGGTDQAATCKGQLPSLVLRFGKGQLPSHVVALRQDLVSNVPSNPTQPALISIQPNPTSTDIHPPLGCISPRRTARQALRVRVRIKIMPLPGARAGAGASAVCAAGAGASLPPVRVVYLAITGSVGSTKRGAGLGASEQLRLGAISSARGAPLCL